VTDLKPPLEWEAWYVEVRECLREINMPLDVWQKTFPYSLRAEFENGAKPSEAASRANEHYWNEQEKVLPTGMRRKL
jgi:hypothetical protein